MTHYYSFIEPYIKSGSQVLDLGCGKGELLSYLIKEKSIDGYGVDIDPRNIIECIKKDIPAIQFDINQPLNIFPNQGYDYVIVSHTLQVIYNFDNLIHDIRRIGKEAIITFPNFSFWSVRLKHLAGLAPKTKDLPYEWYNTPNIRVISIEDFRRFCSKKDIKILKEVPISSSNLIRKLLFKPLRNLFCKKGMFIIEGIKQR